MTSTCFIRLSKLYKRFAVNNLCQRNFFAGRKNNKKPGGASFSERIHLVDAEAIKFTVDAVSLDLSQEKAVIVDTSPGPGLLLEALLKAGAPNVRGLLHNSSPYKSVLQNLKSTYPDRLELCDFDFNNFKSNFSETSGPDRISSVLDSALQSKPVSWTDEPPIKLIVTLTPNTESKVLRRLIIELTLQSGIYASGRSQLFTFISDREYGFMRTKKDVKPAHHQASHILYKSLFHIHHLKTFHWDCLHPTIYVPKGKINGSENVHLVSLIPKMELPDLMHAKDWPDYFYFVKQTMARKKNRVIPFMEKLVPDCGLNLIKTGITVHKTFEDLGPEEFIKLFAEIKSWPELEMSNLANVTKEFTSSSDQFLIHEELLNKR